MEGRVAPWVGACQNGAERDGTVARLWKGSEGSITDVTILSEMRNRREPDRAVLQRVRGTPAPEGGSTLRVPADLERMGTGPIRPGLRGPGCDSSSRGPSGSWFPLQSLVGTASPSRGPDSTPILGILRLSVPLGSLDSTHLAGF